MSSGQKRGKGSRVEGEGQATVGQGGGLSAGSGRGGCALQNAGVGGLKRLQPARLTVSSQRGVSKLELQHPDRQVRSFGFAGAHIQAYLCPHLSLPTEKVTRCYLRSRPVVL